MKTFDLPYHRRNFLIYLCYAIIKGNSIQPTRKTFRLSYESLDRIVSQHEFLLIVLPTLK